MIEGLVKLSPGEYLGNPGFLKLDLMLRGVRVAPELREAGGGEELCSDFGYVGDLVLVLPEDTWVAVPFRTPWAHESPYDLRREGDRTLLRGDAGEVEVRLLPQPAFYRKKTRAGTPCADIGALRGGTLALAPDRSCTLLDTGADCRFCSANRFDTPRVKAIEDVVETVRAAAEEGPLQMVFISVGLMPGDDRGARLVESYVRAIKRNFDVLVGLDACPPASDAWIDRTYAMGIDTLSYNLELWDPERFREVCPGLHAQIGRDRYLAALRHAATVFPAGAVTSHLIVGLEPPESTMAGIDALTDAGVVPVLPVFVPQKGIDLRGMVARVPTADELAPVYGYLYRRLKARKIPLRWVKDISVVTTPLEGRYFVGEEARLQVFLASFYKTAVGRLYMARLSDLRRALRVREVRESLDSSGL